MCPSLIALSVFTCSPYPVYLLSASSLVLCQCVLCHGRRQSGIVLFFLPSVVVFLARWISLFFGPFSSLVERFLFH